ncbi:MAG: hypothetical protein FWG83_02010 [Oscillospiraceae bacterium]|nr:hypothetical protein [Oscillospiraceae bacterium]
MVINMKNKILKLTAKPKRNYQFVQFLLDFLALFLLYVLVSTIVSEIGHDLALNREIKADESIHVNPYPIIIWAVAGLLIFIAGIVLPFIFRKRTKLNQNQYNIWVYSVLLIRILLIMTLYEFLGKHLSFISLRHEPEGIFSFSIVATAVVISILVKFTKIRIRAAAHVVSAKSESGESDKSEKPKKRIVED